MHFTPIISKLLLVLTVALASCAPSRFVKPLAKGEKAVAVHFGGPMIVFSGAPMPIPFTSATGGYGIGEKTTAFTGIQLTDLVYGTVHLEGGVTHQFLDQDAYLPGLSVSPNFEYMFDVWEGNMKFYPKLDFNAFWNYKDKDNYIYLGSSTWFELSGQRAHGVKQDTRVLPNFHLGHQFVNEKREIGIELKYIAPFQSNQNVVIDYISPSKKGVLGLYFSWVKKF